MQEEEVLYERRRWRRWRFSLPVPASAALRMRRKRGEGRKRPDSAKSPAEKSSERFTMGRQSISFDGQTTKQRRGQGTQRNNLTRNGTDSLSFPLRPDYEATRQRSKAAAAAAAQAAQARLPRQQTSSPIQPLLLTHSIRHLGRAPMIPTVDVRRDDSIHIRWQADRSNEPRRLRRYRYSNKHTQAQEARKLSNSRTR
jgi:hypothetical protein